MVRSQGAPDRNEVDAFSGCGLRGQVLYVILAISVKTLSNYSNRLRHACRRHVRCLQPRLKPAAAACSPSRSDPDAHEPLRPYRTTLMAIALVGSCLSCSWSSPTHGHPQQAQGGLSHSRRQQQLPVPRGTHTSTPTRKHRCVRRVWRRRRPGRQPCPAQWPLGAVAGLIWLAHMAFYLCEPQADAITVVRCEPRIAARDGATVLMAA